MIVSKCPLCKGVARLRHSGPWYSDHAYVVCDECKLSGPWSQLGFDNSNRSDHRAILDWNALCKLVRKGLKVSKS